MSVYNTFILDILEITFILDILEITCILDILEITCILDILEINCILDILEINSILCTFLHALLTRILGIIYILSYLHSWQTLLT